MKKIDRIIKKKLNNLKKNFNFKDCELHEIEKMYRGLEFDASDVGYVKLLEESKKIYQKYDELKFELAINKNIFKTIVGYFKKVHIIHSIFPIHGFMSMVSDRCFSVIGCVDFHGVGFINYGVRFNEGSLVDVGSYVQFAPNVSVGNGFDGKKYGKITIGKNSWICASTIIKNNTTIEEEVILKLGETASGKLLKGYIYDSNGTIKEAKEKSKYSSYVKKENDIDIAKIKEEFKRYNIKCNKEYIKYLKGIPFNNISLSGLYLLTHNLVSEFNNPKTSKTRKEEILDILFVKKGKLTVEGKIYIDMLKTIEVGNNCVIKDNCYLGGVIELGDNVTLEEGVTIFSVGHSLDYKMRKTRFNLRYLIHELGRSDKTIIGDNVTLSSGKSIGPNQRID